MDLLMAILSWEIVSLLRRLSIIPVTLKTWSFNCLLRLASYLAIELSEHRSRKGLREKEGDVDEDVDNTAIAGGGGSSGQTKVDFGE